MRSRKAKNLSLVKEHVNSKYFKDNSASLFISDTRRARVFVRILVHLECKWFAFYGELRRPTYNALDEINDKMGYSGDSTTKFGQYI